MGEEDKLLSKISSPGCTSECELEGLQYCTLSVSAHARVRKQREWIYNYLLLNLWRGATV